MIWGLLGFLITISFLVTIHEYGHFWTARRFGVKILRFSLGFGKPIYTRTGRDGTLYTIAPIPLGGFVQMYGETEEEPIAETDKHLTFSAKAPWQRFLIAFAGPFVNLVFAVLAFALLFMSGVQGLTPTVAYIAPQSMAAEAGLQVGDVIQRVGDTSVKLSIDAHVALVSAPRQEIVLDYERKGEKRSTRLDLSDLQAGDELKLAEVLGLYLVDEWLPALVAETVEDSAAQQFGIQANDEIISINQQRIDLIRIGKQIAAIPNQAASIEVLRQGQVLSLNGVIGQRQNEQGEVIGFLGVRWQGVDVSAYESVERYGFFRSIYKGIEKTLYYVRLTFDMFGRMIMGEVSLDNVGGPLTIGDAAGQTMKIGWDVFLNFLGVVSLSLAAINLLPIPMLDGGHMLFTTLEMLRGKPLSERAMALSYRVGATVVISFMLFVVLKDLDRYLFGFF